MEFVFSVWYIVAAVLVVGIIACLVVFFKMDKEDRVLVDEFIKTNQSNSNATKEETDAK